MLFIKEWAVSHGPLHPSRLRELCVKLMFLHPVDYGRKAEELLWRKVYYEVIQLIKTNKKVREDPRSWEEIFF